MLRPLVCSWQSSGSGAVRPRPSGGSTLGFNQELDKAIEKLLPLQRLEGATAIRVPAIDVRLLNDAELNFSGLVGIMIDMTQSQGLVAKIGQRWQAAAPARALELERPGQLQAGRLAPHPVRYSTGSCSEIVAWSPGRKMDRWGPCSKLVRTGGGLPADIFAPSARRNEGANRSEPGECRYQPSVGEIRSAIHLCVMHRAGDCRSPDRHRHWRAAHQPRPGGKNHEGGGHADALGQARRHGLSRAVLVNS